MLADENLSIALSLDIKKQVLELWEKNRLRCGWFIRPDFIPQTREDFFYCLELITKQGDRTTYVLARKLLKCL
jgi:hypothetical protein